MPVVWMDRLPTIKHHAEAVTFEATCKLLGKINRKIGSLHTPGNRAMAGSEEVARRDLVLNVFVWTANVGFYQVAKLLMSPFVAAVEVLWLKKRFPVSALACIVVVLTGVAVVTVNDVTVNGPGLAMAALFIVTGGSQQILCGHLQTALQLQSHQLMSNTSFLQGMILMIVGPFVDKLACSKWILEWEASVPGLEMLALSCLLAVAVNGSQFLVLGRFTATSFQVLGHAKTLLVLLGGWLLFDEPINPRKAFGKVVGGVGRGVSRGEDEDREQRGATFLWVGQGKLPCSVFCRCCYRANVTRVLSKVVV
ncbi:hypothetical protein VOLCADRAFT_90933 [Volvox carteri f. nagariensis]|uniref:Sugar phosphate transporter domain-containing protein n=1 Tax=Volvox carteri f. nagariensis TaxID=3068 RepID=D8TVR8_VOLCA|nr:uncharacterized protein VOLCADRAFT_90933 [Volvox carteri f. nagariensis]EFJ48350.1 hypothetical protein VOLCADRAFT_90933 [Volvox carteri f. nagariensis]|eukprot:XP_002950604.1 hypothetical protein VOLCADRAFT_90933 [Volvox carteri f. nagariensis]